MPNDYIEVAEINGTEYDLHDVGARADLETKAEVDGYYEGLTSGMAEQLVSTVGVTDSVPYNRRTTGGSADVGDRLAERAIVGGSVAWNQLAKALDGVSWRGNNATNDYTDGVATVTPSSYSTNAVGLFSLTKIIIGNDHKYIAVADVFSDNSGTICVGRDMAACNRTVQENTWTRISTIFTNDADRAFVVYARATLSGWSSGTFKVKNPQLFDLTALFGSTIADYIYSLETANTGSGVAWLKNHGYFLKPYYPYTPAPSMESVMVGEHRTVGFNQWDEEWEVGTIGGYDGQNASDSTRIRSKNYIPVLPSTQYYFKGQCDMFYYDADKNYLGNTTGVSNSSVTMWSNCYYMRFRAPTSYGTTYKKDICLHIRWDGSRDGEYEPYVERTYALDSSVVLRGMMKLDAYNNAYYDGDKYYPDGTVERRFGIKVLDGTENFTLSAQSGDNPRRFLLNISSWGAVGTAWRTTAVSSHLIINLTASASEAFGTFRISTTYLTIPDADSKFADATAFKTWLESNPITIIYELATPTTETAEPWQETQIIDDFGTEEYTDYAYENGDRDFSLPVGHDSYYQANLRAKLEMAPNSPDDGDGDYIVRQTGGINEYVKLSIATELPANPSTDGSYHLAVTVSGGAATLAWVSDS